MWTKNGFSTYPIEADTDLQNEISKAFGEGGECHVAVVKQGRGVGACVVDEAAAVADFGVEHLAGGKCLVRLNEVDDVVGHLVVGTPWDVLHPLGDEYGGDIVLLFEDLGGVGGEGGGFVGAGDMGNGSSE